MLIVIAGRELCHKANPLGVSAAPPFGRRLRAVCPDANSAQDRGSSTRNQELIVGAIWHMIGGAVQGVIRT
jgi:hypothetical protein